MPRRSAPHRLAPLRIVPADTRRELERCFRFARTVYRNDPNWVEPILADRLAKVDPGRNPFWRTAERRLWMALRGEDVAGTIAAIHDRRSNEALHQSLGTFGFFECLEDPEAAGLLVDTAAAWLATRGLSAMRGPYNPSADDEPGILVEGFDTLPAIMEGHAPPYYARLLEGAGMRKHQDMFARLVVRPPGDHPFLEDAAPRLRRAIEIAGRRDRGVVIRTLDRRRWDEDIRTACRLFNAALAYLPEHVPVSEEEFLAMAEGLKPILDDELALLAEVDGRPAGFALVLPDVNQALRHVHGRLGLIGTLRFLRHRRSIDRAAFKIMMVAPEFQDRFVEVLILARLGEAIWRKGYREVDLSMTGDENWKSNRIQERTGPRVYRRYRIYQKDLRSAGGDRS
jgi:GNAT superfamily N-acetyltransferase